MFKSSIYIFILDCTSIKYILALRKTSWSPLMLQLDMGLLELLTVLTKLALKLLFQI